MIDLTPLLQAIIGMCAAVITAYTIPWIKEQAGLAKTRRLYDAAAIAVRAAEQIYGSGSGEKKMKYVMDYLEQHGFRLSVEELRNALEAAVHEMNAAVYGTKETA